VRFFNEQPVIKVSARMARLKFIECGPKCIATGCTAKCCDAPTRPTGMFVHILPEEEDSLLTIFGPRVRDGLLLPKDDTSSGCPFKTNKHLCRLHLTSRKPFGCTVSPFALNKSGTLIIRNRYKLLPCYDKDFGLPAYHTFKTSLQMLFGNGYETLKIHLDTGGGDRLMPIHQSMLDKLTDIQNDMERHSKDGQKRISKGA